MAAEDIETAARVQCGMARQNGGNVFGGPGGQTVETGSACRFGRFIAADQLDRRAKPIAALGQFGDRGLLPDDLSFAVQAKACIFGFGNFTEAFEKDWCERRLGGQTHGLAFNRAGGGVGFKHQPVQPANRVALDTDLPIGRQLSH